MSSKRFVVLALILTSAGVVLIATFAYVTNIYGLFGDVKGASYRPYHPYARVTKYLFTYNYVPSNFDGLLHGSSFAANWNTKGIEGRKIYNCSLRGSNIAEQKRLMDSALNRGDIRLVMFALNGLFLGKHDVNDSDFESGQYWASLGSPRLLGNTLAKAGVECGSLRNYFDDYGTQTFRLTDTPYDVSTAMKLAAERKLQNHKKETEFAVDPIALEMLKEAIETVQSRDATVLLIHPPIYIERFSVVEDEYAAFQEAVHPLLSGKGCVLDFNNGEYDYIRSDIANYIDSVHYSDQGAKVIVEALNTFLAAIPQQ